jgi:predicted transport protein
MNWMVIFVKVNPATIRPKLGFTRDVSRIGHFGTGGLEITLSKAEDLEEAKPLIELSYAAS